MPPRLARRGANALAEINTDVARICAVITDIKLFGSDGWEIARRPRELAPEMPVRLLLRPRGSKCAGSAIKEELVVATARRLLPFGVALMLGACALEPTPNPAAIIVPGPEKDVAAFQQDDVICRSHAATGTGYGDLSQRPT
jgi:hypothetical protein